MHGYVVFGFILGKPAVLFEFMWSFFSHAPVFMGFTVVTTCLWVNDVETYVSPYQKYNSFDHNVVR